LASSSVGTPDDKLVKKSIKILIEYLRENDRVSLVIFNNNAHRLFPLLKMNNSNKKKNFLLKKLKEIEASGGTNIGSGIYKAWEILRQRKQSNEVSSIFLLSDGQDTSGIDINNLKLKKAYYSNLINSDYVINSFGYGLDHDPKMLSTISQLKDGNFYFIEDLNKVTLSFVDCLGALASTILENTAITIKPNDNQGLILIKKAYGMEGIWNYDTFEKSHSAVISHLIHGKSYNYVFEVELPKNYKLDPKSFQASISGILVYNKLTLSKSIDMIKDHYSEDTIIQYHRVSTAEILKNSINLTDQGKFKQANEEISIQIKKLKETNVKEKDYLNNLAKDLEITLENIKPENYEQKGKADLAQNSASHMTEKTTHSGNTYRYYSSNTQRGYRADL